MPPRHMVMNGNAGHVYFKRSEVAGDFVLKTAEEFEEVTNGAGWMRVLGPPFVHGVCI